MPWTGKAVAHQPTGPRIFNPPPLRAPRAGKIVGKVVSHWSPQLVCFTIRIYKVQWLFHKDVVFQQEKF